MLSIADVDPSCRYLMLAARVSARRWKQECDSVRAWLASETSGVDEQDARQMLRTIDSPLPADAIPMVVVHCYADVPAGTSYQRVFDPATPGNHQATVAQVIFGMVMERYVTSTLAAGWHQTVVMRFPEGLPSLLTQLPIDKVTTKYLGLCTDGDFPEIQKARLGRPT